LHKSLKIL